MVNILLFTYYHKYKQSRKVIRDLINIDNDIEQAATKLNQVIQEHDNYINNNTISLDQDTFTTTDNLSLHHAKDHLDSLQQNPDSTIQKTASVEALNEE